MNKDHHADLVDGQVILVEAHGVQYLYDSGYEAFREETEQSGCTECQKLCEDIDKEIKP